MLCATILIISVFSQSQAAKDGNQEEERTVEFLSNLLNMGTDLASVLPTVGKCPSKPSTINPFNVTEYLGRWYEQRRLPTFFQLNMECVVADYGEMPDKPGNISVHNMGTGEDGDSVDILGYAYVPNPNFPGELLVKFPASPEGDYWILDTDYKTYSVVYTCQDIFGVLKLDFAWILSREKNLDADILEKATNILKESGVDTGRLKDTRQNQDCEYKNTV